MSWTIVGLCKTELGIVSRNFEDFLGLKATKLKHVTAVGLQNINPPVAFFNNLNPTVLFK